MSRPRARGEIATVVTVAISATGALFTAAPVLAALLEEQNRQNVNDVMLIALAILAVGGAAGLLWRRIFRPLSLVLLGRSPSGIPGHPDYDPGQPNLSEFIRDTLEHRLEDARWKQEMTGTVRELTDYLEAVHPRKENTP